MNSDEVITDILKEAFPKNMQASVTDGSRKFSELFRRACLKNKQRQLHLYFYYYTRLIKL